MKIEDNRESYRRYYSHAVSFYLKMHPSERNEDIPDLLLTADSGAVSLIYEDLSLLKHGDEIIFNATIHLMKKGVGVSEGKHLHLVDLKRTGKNDPKVHIFVSPQEIQWFNQHVLNKNAKGELRKN